MKLFRNTSQSGFTLVEMLVSISIFTIVVTMAVSTLLVLIEANGRAQSMQLIMTNLTFTLDSMTREIRTGFNWSCGDYGGSGEPGIPLDTDEDDCSCDGDGTSCYISIIESGDSLTEGLNSERVTYWHDASTGSIKRKLGDDTVDTDEEWIPLTGPEIIIDEMRIFVTDTDRQQRDGDVVQPTATIYIKGRAGVTLAETSGTQVREFDVQTTITQRLLDI